MSIGMVEIAIIVVVSVLCVGGIAAVGFGVYAAMNKNDRNDG